jgi:hypothetical protein
MTGSRCDPRYGVEQYEALRREAMEELSIGPRGHGLMLFLTRGMPAWLAVLSSLLPPSPAASVAVSSPDPLRLASSARAELTSVLAGMVWACSQASEGAGCKAPAR